MKKIVVLFIVFVGLIFIGTQVAYSAELSGPLQFDKQIVEHLKISVPAKNKNAWLQAEKESWEPWLKKQKGFKNRQLLWDPKGEEATVLIVWNSREEWKNISQEEINFTQEKFEQSARSSLGLKNGNPFPLTYEGELLQQ